MRSGIGSRKVIACRSGYNAPIFVLFLLKIQQRSLTCKECRTLQTPHTLWYTIKLSDFFFYITAPIQMILLYATWGTYWTSLPAFQYIFAIIKEINGTKNKIPIGLKWTLHVLRVPKHTGFVWWPYADRVYCSTVNIWTVRRMQCVKYSSILSFILLFQKSNNFFSTPHVWFWYILVWPYAAI